MQSKYCSTGCIFNNSSNTHADCLLTLINLRNFLSLRAFTVYMENSLRLAISLIFTNLHRSEFHFARGHVNADKEITLHRGEILP